jgi:chemotaxis protein CheC
VKLLPTQQDTLREIANIGVSKAATQLSILLDDTIHLVVPDVRIMEVGEVAEMLGRDGQSLMTVVSEQMSGALTGRIKMIFHNEDSKKLVAGLLGSVPVSEGFDMREYEFEAVKEIGNIVISSCGAAFAELFGEEIILSAPNFVNKTPDDMFSDRFDASDIKLLVMDTVLHLAQSDLKGMVMIILSIKSVENMLSRLNHIIRQGVE